ncbi:MAG: hypothetical protein DRP16_01325 [Candidatus Aenigmatarchaeota archaeon]|nr:MAG: hypothetical protein DRP16_01325 [Candidatus Aenigmarchaeota archaeon]
MKKWEEWKDFIDKGDWHVHTDFTQGENTITDMCKQAKANRLKLIVFTKYVRKDDSTLSNFCIEIEKIRKKFSTLKILIGCEAKVTDKKGNLTASIKDMEKCDVVLGSFKGVPSRNKETLLTALKNMIKNPSVDIWAHPSSFFERCALTQKEIEEVIDLCIKNKVLIENNINHNYKMPRFIEFAKDMGAEIVTGSDAHNTAELRKI